MASGASVFGRCSAVAAMGFYAAVFLAFGAVCSASLNLSAIGFGCSRGLIWCTFR